MKMEFQNGGQRNVVQLVKCYSLQSLVRARVGLMYSVLLQAGKVERSSHFSPVLFQPFHLRKQRNVQCRESPGVQNGSALDGGRIGWLGEWKRALSNYSGDGGKHPNSSDSLTQVCTASSQAIFAGV